MLGHVLYSWGSWAGVEEHHITAFGHFEARTMHGMVNVDCFFLYFSRCFILYHGIPGASELEHVPLARPFFYLAI